MNPHGRRHRYRHVTRADKLEHRLMVRESINGDKQPLPEIMLFLKMLDVSPPTGAQVIYGLDFVLTLWIPCR